MQCAAIPRHVSLENKPGGVTEREVTAAMAKILPRYSASALNQGMPLAYWVYVSVVCILDCACV